MIFNKYLAEWAINQVSDKFLFGIITFFFFTFYIRGIDFRPRYKILAEKCHNKNIKILSIFKTPKLFLSSPMTSEIVSEGPMLFAF